MKWTTNIIIVSILSSCQYHDFNWDGEKPPKGRVTVEQDYRELVASEREFAEFTENNNIRDGFIRFLADDGIIFRNGFVNGKDFYLPQEPSPTVLSWQPQYADISRSGDFGYTTGPYQIQFSRDQPPELFGHYISVWSKDDSEGWRVVFDIGAPYPEEKSFPDLAFPDKYPLKISIPADTAETKSFLIELEEVFSSNSSSNNLRAAYERFLSDDVLLFRIGSFPFDTEQAVNELVQSSVQSVAYEPINGKVSIAGDLGYVYGFTRQGDNSPSPYLHIWKFEKAGRWKIVLEVLSL